MRTIITKSGDEWMLLDSATILMHISDEEYGALLDGTKRPVDFPMHQDAKATAVMQGDAVLTLETYTTEFQHYSSEYPKDHRF
ncbi:MAG: hypothetical protein ACOYD0_11825 [Candidatus Nanopelagicales bacterium]